MTWDELNTWSVLKWWAGDHCYCKTSSISIWSAFIIYWIPIIARRDFISRWDFPGKINGKYETISKIHLIIKQSVLHTILSANLSCIILKIDKKYLTHWKIYFIACPHSQSSTLLQHKVKWFTFSLHYVVSLHISAFLQIHLLKYKCIKSEKKVVSPALHSGLLTIPPSFL